MPQRKTILLVVFLLMLSGKIFAQQKLSSIDSISIFENSINYFSMKMRDTRMLKINLFPITEQLTKAEAIDKNFYTTHLGFFCKKEIQLEKITSVPFRFRLGSLEYVNKMEGKIY